MYGSSQLSFSAKEITAHPPSVGPAHLNFVLAIRLNWDL